MGTQDKLLLFIRQYIGKSRKRRSHNNNIEKITETINRVFKKNMADHKAFQQDEIAEAFQACGFEFMTNKPEEFTWEQFFAGSALFGDGTFINIQVQDLKDLKLTTIALSPNSAGEEVIKKSEELRKELKRFFEVHTEKS